MGRLIKTLENRTALVFAAISAAVCALTFGACLWVTDICANQVQTQVSDHMLAVAGRLSQNTDIPDEQIAAAFAQRGTQEAKLGERVLSDRGFEVGTGKGHEYAYSQPVLPCLAAAAGVFLCAVLGCACFMHIFADIRKMTLSAQNKQKCLDELSDRDLELLAEQVDRLIAERERSIGQISQEKKALAQYLQDFSHQIKTPAAGLTLNNEICRTHEMDRDELLGYLDKDRVCIERITKLCSQSLKLARLQAGTIEYKIAPCSVYSIAERACAPLYELAAENGTEIEIQIPNEITLQCDELWLCEAVSNLVKNACEHTKGGCVQVFAKQTPLCTELFIKDNGEGIAHEDIPQLFRRFYSRSNDTDPSAVGIGMSIAKHITQDLGGKMYIESAVGKGTSIRLEFLH